MLLRVDGELVAAGAEGTILAGPDGPFALVRGRASALSRRAPAATG